jgi:hypothetical protein
VAHRPGVVALQKPFSELDLGHAIRRAFVTPSGS